MKLGAYQRICAYKQQCAYVVLELLAVHVDVLHEDAVLTSIYSPDFTLWPWQ